MAACRFLDPARRSQMKAVARRGEAGGEGDVKRAAKWSAKQNAGFDAWR
jgi:hypothetical protein